MKTPNEQIEELIKKIHEETGEKIVSFYAHWQSVFGQNGELTSIDVTISKGN